MLDRNILEIKVEKELLWNDELQEFYEIHERTFHFEFSLATISKWEMKWHISYLHKEEKTEEQARDMIRCMCLDDIDELYLSLIVTKYRSQINEYVNNPMTATIISEDKSKSHSRNNVITNEQIYHMMTANNIPFECEHWHFNRLMTLIRVCNESNGEHKKMSNKEVLEYQAALNKARRAKKGL